MVSKTHKNLPPARRLGRRGRMAVAVMAAVLLTACTDSPEAMVSSARGYIEKKDFNAAGIQLKNALQENANLSDARFLLGKVNLAQDNLPGAVKEFQRALELGYSRNEVAPLLARALVLTGEFDRVLKDFGDQSLDDPAAQASLMASVGDAYFAKRDVAKARASYEKSLAAGDAVLARVGLARVKLHGGDPAGAAVDLRAMVENNADVVEVHAALAELAAIQKQPEEAIKALEQVVRLKPSNVASHYTLISMLLQLNRQDEALTRLEAMKKVAPKDPATIYLQAYVDFRNNRFAEARDGVLLALKYAPEFLPAHLLAGTVLVRLNEQVQAQIHLGKVLARAPGQTMARTMLVASHLALGESQRALEVLQPMLDQPMSDPRLLGIAGQVFLANGDYEKAEAYFERSAKAAPEDARARMQVGVAKMAAGDVEGAFDELETASDMDDKGIRADLALVAGHMRRGELEQAAKALTEAERKQPDNPLVYNVRGGLMLAKKDPAGARAAFEKALSLKADYLAAAVNLARMDIADKRPDAGLARLKAIADRDPKNTEAQLAYAQLQLATKAEPAAVLATLERAEKAAPSALVPKLAIVQHHLRTRDTKAALAVAQQAVAAHPNDPRALETVARAQLAAGDTQQAIASLNKLVTVMPRSSAPLVMLSDVYRSNKDLAAAENALRKALGLRADAVDVQARLAAVLLERGERDGALQVAKSVQKQQPNAAVGHMLEGDIQSAGGKWAEAAVAYRRGFEKGKEAQNLIKLHAALMRAERKADGDKLAADWLRENSKDIAVRGYIAERALAEKRFGDAVQLFRTMNELSPNNALVLNNLAWAEHQLKDPKALAHAEAALAVAADNPAILDTLGMIQVDNGQVDKGLANLVRATSLAPDAQPLRLNLAKAYAKAGKVAEARKELQTMMPKLKEGTAIHSEASALLKTL